MFRSSDVPDLHCLLPRWTGCGHLTRNLSPRLQSSMTLSPSPATKMLMPDSLWTSSTPSINPPTEMSRCTTSSHSESGTDSDSSGPAQHSQCTFRRRPRLALREHSPKRSAVRCHVSTLALALTSVLWQQPQWRATPSPSGAFELSQHRRQTFSADGDSGRSHLPLHDAALPLCSSVSDNNPTQHPLRTQKPPVTSPGTHITKFRHPDW